MVVVIIITSWLLLISTLLFLSFVSRASVRTNNSEKPQLSVSLFLCDLEMLNVGTDLFAYKPRLGATTLGFGAESQPLVLLSLGHKAWWARWQPFGTRSPVLWSSISPRPLCHSPTTGLGWLVSLLSGQGTREREKAYMTGHQVDGTSAVTSPQHLCQWVLVTAPQFVFGGTTPLLLSLGETTHQGARPSLTSGWACHPSWVKQTFSPWFWVVWKEPKDRKWLEQPVCLLLVLMHPRGAVQVPRLLRLTPASNPILWALPYPSDECLSCLSWILFHPNNPSRGTKVD